MLKEFISSIDSTDTIYDLIACCCDCIYSAIPNEELFLSTYIDRDIAFSAKKIITGKSKENPNLENLNTLSKSIWAMLQSAMPEGQHGNYSSFFKPSLLWQLNAFTLVPYCDNNCNEATVPFVVLQTIDSFLSGVNSLQDSSGPKGNYTQYETLIYPVGKNTIISAASENLDFRKKIHPSKIRDILLAVRVVQKQQLKNRNYIPKIVNIYTKNRDVQQKISFAYIPYSVHREFDFISNRGSSFTVKYHTVDEDKMRNRLESLLERAIKAKANIIVLPEYVVSEGMLKEIKRILKKKKIETPDSLDTLIMVVAGSTWDSNNNNISHIFNNSGNEVGVYYKYSPFISESEAERKARGAVYDCCEHLEIPGKECTLVSVKGIGHILPAICRDIIDENYTVDLAKIFHPSIIVTPAWSLSVARFHGSFESYAHSFHTASFLFNSCQNFKDKIENSESVEFSCACFPTKNKSETKGVIFPIENDKCRGDCGKGCVFLIEADFSPEKVMAKISITSSQYLLNQ